MLQQILKVPTISAYHMVENLGSGLYGSIAQKVMELGRNGLVASMPDADTLWEPHKAKIEILLTMHPLAPKSEKALVVLDHGCGLTAPALDNYFGSVGTSLTQLKKRASGSYTGASQKGIGRFAALGLNRYAYEEDVEVRIKYCRYYILSRTSSSGRVRFVSVIPEQIETQGGFAIENYIEPNATEMGPLKGIQGSFTAIVIPTPLSELGSNDDIYQEIKWHLPREADKMFPLFIGGKQVEPPPLESTVNLTSGEYRARLGEGDDTSDGVWLCDATTGFRVASCARLGRGVLPDPLWMPQGIAGDIFCPGLLRHQDTSRGTLTRSYTSRRNKDWNRFYRFLFAEVAPAAKKLVERDAISGEAAKALDEVIDMFRDTFGEADEADDTPVNPRGPRQKPYKPRGPNTGTATSYRRYVSIKVRDETYTIIRGQTIDPYLYAEAAHQNPYQIIVNVRGNYKPLPKNKDARREHCLMQILSVIGQTKSPLDQREATKFANTVRSEMMQKRSA